MAEGFAHATGSPGVCMVTSGPAATNIVTPLCDAYMDSVPMVCITGQVPYAAIGTDAFQECDTVGITRSVTKHNELVTEAQDIPLMVRQAFHLATTGRPGPVLVDVPKDIVDPQNPRSAMEWYWPTDDEVAASLPGYRPTTKGHPKKIRQAAELILQARRPVIYAGGGILKARAAEALRELAELCDIHVVTTLMARGAFPDDHPLCLGMPGMHGNYTAVTSMQQSDLLIALGSRFDDRITGRVDTSPPTPRSSTSTSTRPSSARSAVPTCRSSATAAWSSRSCRGGPKLVDGGEESPTATPGSRDLGLAGALPAHLRAVRARRDAQAPVRPRAAARRHPDDTILASGVGQHQMWASQYWKFNHPYTWVNSGGLGTMGFAVRPPSAPRWAGPTAWCGRSTATAASR